jgi:cell division protein ZapA (FtsZ GTPase activity inhibitor)
MVKSLVISIDNKSYKVVGECEELMQKSAELLNAEIQEVSSKIGNMPSLTKTTLAALNIVEVGILKENKYLQDTGNIAAEINRITDFINANIDGTNYN